MNIAYLHGFASGPQATKAQAISAMLAERNIRLRIPDLNTPSFSAMTVSAMLARMEELTRTGGPWGLIGSSMGGLLAAFFAARFPDRVDRVMLLCPAFDLHLLFTHSLGEEGMARWKTTGHHEFPDASGTAAPVHWGLVEDLADFAGFPPVLHPACVIHGTLDASVPVESSRRFAATNSLIQLVEVEDDHRLTVSIPRIHAEIRDFWNI